MLFKHKMIVSHSRKFLNNSGKAQAQYAVGDSISINFGQFISSEHTRRAHREYQSHAAKQLLSKALRGYPDQASALTWQLEKTTNGKPYLIGDRPPAISLAHSKNWIACAVADVECIGIDIETIKHRDWNHCSDIFFHPEETRWILNAPKTEQNIRGLVCWCRKEAITKATGIGMVGPLSKIAFSPDGKLIALPSIMGTPENWTCHTSVIQNKAVIAAVWKN